MHHNQLTKAWPFFRLVTYREKQASEKDFHMQLSIILATAATRSTDDPGHWLGPTQISRASFYITFETRFEISPNTDILAQY